MLVMTASLPEPGERGKRGQGLAQASEGKGVGRTLALELDVVAELASLALNLDALGKELFVRSGVEL